MVRILILGGTVFLGRHLVDAALDRGDQVTLFHRGRHEPHRRAEVEELLGDRGTGLNLLRGRRFDAVIDTCGYLPSDVRLSAEQIDARHYVFVSSGSVYADTTDLPLTENSTLLDPPDPAETQVHGALYGPQKVGCERELLAVRGSSALVARAGLLVGPHDPTDRLTYWVTRMLRPGPVLAPDVPDQPVQFIDARDLASWLLVAATAGHVGVFNANGPRRVLTFGGLLQLAAEPATQPADLHWVDEDALIDAGVAPWSELPIWLPARFGVSGLMDMDTTRAQAAGLTTRPTPDTLSDIARWAAGTADRVTADYGTRSRSSVLTAERESQLVAALPVRR